MSEDEVAQILGIYQTSVLIQFNADLLEETARRVANGELGGVEEMGVILGLVGLVQGVEEAVPYASPPDSLSSAWNKAVEIHEQTKKVIARWLNEEILSPQVVEEMGPISEDVDSLGDELQTVMVEIYGFDSDQIAQYHQEVMDTVSEIFESTSE